MSTHVAKEAQAEFQMGNARIPINGVTLVHTIDELPYAEISVQLDNEGNPDPAVRRIGSVTMDLNKFNALTRVTQEKILNKYQINPDTQLAMHDGDGNSITLKGFLGRPEFRLRDGEVYMGFSLVHAMAILQSVNLRIYGAQENYALTLLRSFFDFDSESRAIIKADSIADRMRVLINGMIRKSALLPDLVDSTKYDALPIHNLNLTALDKVITFLKNSSKTTTIGGIAEPDFENDNLLHTLFTIMNEAPNFFQCLGEICSAFMLQLNADYKGNAWLEWSQINTDAKSREITVPVQNVNFSMGNIFQVPVLQVIVQGRGMDLYGFAGNFGVVQGQAPLVPGQADDASNKLSNAIVATGDTGIQLTAIAKWPAAIPRNAVGTFFLLDAPYWLNPERVTYDQATALSNLTQLDKDTYKAAIEAANKALDQMVGAAKTRKQVMTYMAKQQFRSLYLSGTTGQISMPLNLQVKPGYMYHVKSVTGEPIFKGFLVRATHDIKIAEGGAAATTSLMFSNVLAPGAVINALQDVPDFPTASLTPNSSKLGDINLNPLAAATA